MDAASGFMAFAPCTSASAYVSNTTQIAFGGTLGLDYSPACVKIAPGTALTFSGDFADPPADSVGQPDHGRSNPIVSTDTGDDRELHLRHARLRRLLLPAARQ